MAEMVMDATGTKKLFYDNSHMKEFDADIISCEPDKEGYSIVLNQTAFFPEGGGQYADTGYLDEVEVVDVKEKAGMIYHKAKEPISVGTKVHGILNWEQRFERMQQHSGEHIVSGLVHERFGYENVGFHLGADYCTMDFNGSISQEELKEIELEANKAVYQNLPVEVTYPSKEILADMEYRSKIEIDGQVRIVTVPGYDVCACCAPHVNQTGEIGMIKLVDMINYKGGQRVTMLAGIRALTDYNIKAENAKAIGALLCEKENQIQEAVSRLKDEQTSLKNKNAQLQQQMLSYRASEIDVTSPVVCVFDAELSGNGPRELMNLLLEKGAKICGVFAGTDENGYRYVLGSRSEDVRPLCKELNVACNGRGGGKPEMVQGSLAGHQDDILKILR